MTRLLCSRVGAGEPLVLLHALGLTRASWEPVLPELARHFEVLTIDLPGFGDSPALSKKDTGPASRQIDAIVLQLAVADVAVSKHFYFDHDLTVAKSYGSRYVEFDTGPVKLSLNKRRALAKSAGVSPDGTGSHRLLIGSDAGAFTDPDGFVWKSPRDCARGL